MISVVIPVYNHPERLKKALQSLARQTYNDIEVIVVDDGSVESIESVMERFKPRLSRLRHYRIPHGGANKARQYGFELSSGEYIIFWDNDVVGRNIMLETMLDTLRQHPDASYVYSRYWYGWKRFKIWPFNPERLRCMPYIHTTSLVRYKHFPGWDPELERLQDWDVWLTMLEQGHGGRYIPRCLFRVIIGGTMSAWLPKSAYRPPFKKYLPAWLKDRVEKYERAVGIIRRKHQL